MYIYIYISYILYIYIIYIYIYIYTHNIYIYIYTYIIYIYTYIHVCVRVRILPQLILLPQKHWDARSFMSGTMPKAVAHLGLCWCPFCCFGVGALITRE